VNGVSDLPELTESDAPESIRVVYAGFRAGAHTPIAALIWRHVATYPGTLEACWAALGPLFEGGHVPLVADRVVRETTPAGLLSRLGPQERVALSVTPEDAPTLMAVVEAYNRANPVNLLAVLALLARVESNAPPVPLLPVTYTPPPAITRALPRMTPPAEIDAATRRLLDDLRPADGVGEASVIPSLYRHLTGFPAYLATLHEGLAPHFRDGTIRRAAARVERAMADEARALAGHMAPVPQLAENTALQATMHRFAGGFIPTMIVVGRAMAEQLGEARNP
jgi:hypothetical protein